MDAVFEFLKSDIGVAIAWVCTVGSTILGFVKVKEVKALKLKIKSLEINISNLGDDIVSQSGQGNIYTKQNSGGMNIKM